MRAQKTSWLGFFLGLFAIAASVFGIVAWLLTEASSIITLTLMILIAAFGVITCAFHVWNKTSSHSKSG